jgi:hypothetical protein
VGRGGSTDVSGLSFVAKTRSLLTQSRYAATDAISIAISTGIAATGTIRCRKRAQRVVGGQGKKPSILSILRVNLEESRLKIQPYKCQQEQLASAEFRDKANGSVVFASALSISEHLCKTDEL